MIDNALFHALLLVGFLWLCMILYAVHLQTQPTKRKPAQPAQKRSRDPKPFPGPTHKPHCAACEYTAEAVRQVSPIPPPGIRSAHGRPRAVDTSHHFCPKPTCRYYGWVGHDNIRANEHPSGGPWRQLQCVMCQGYFLETHDTLFHGKRVPAERIVYVVAALAEGLGIRAVARVFAVDPNTVLEWLIEAADHLQAFARYVVHNVHVRQVQLDELFTLVSAVKAGEVSNAEAITRLSRSPHWVWAAIDPVSKLLLGHCQLAARLVERSPGVPYSGHEHTIYQPL
jgi:hypothetical protein